MFRGTLQTCIDHLTRHDTALHAVFFMVIHLPRSKCYNVIPAANFDNWHLDHATQEHRILFHGTIKEAAHFVLAPQLSLLVNRSGAPELPDNVPPAIAPGDIEGEKITAPETPAAEPVVAADQEGTADNGDNS